MDNQRKRDCRKQTDNNQKTIKELQEQLQRLKQLLKNKTLQEKTGFSTTTIVEVFDEHGNLKDKRIV